jgi:hypothetical protein
MNSYQPEPEPVQKYGKRDAIFDGTQLRARVREASGGRAVEPERVKKVAERAQSVAATGGRYRLLFPTGNGDPKHR